METDTSSLRVLGLAAIAALTAFVITFVTGWGINSGWSIFILAFVIFIVLTFFSSYIEGRFSA